MGNSLDRWIEGRFEKKRGAILSVTVGTLKIPSPREGGEAES